MSSYNADPFNDSVVSSNVSGPRSQRSHHNTSSHHTTSTTYSNRLLQPEVNDLHKPLTYDDLPARRIVSGLGWTAFALSLIGNLINTTTFFAPGWAWTREHGRDTWAGEYHGEYGMWYTCSRPEIRTRSTYCIMFTSVPSVAGWFRGCQALALLMFGLGIITLVVCICYVFYIKWNRKPKVAGAIVALSAITGCVIVGLVALFAVQYLREISQCCPEEGRVILEYHLYYCFGLACVAVLFHFGTAIVAAVELYRLRQ